MIINTEEIIFLAVYQDLLLTKEDIAPRKERTKEIQDYVFILAPYERFTSFKARNMSMDYIKAEFKWYMSGDPYNDMITEHAQIWKDIRQPDGRFFSNYGHYIFGTQGGAQFVVDELVIDRDSRRAVIPLLNASHLFHENKDVVCTYSIGFRIRNNFFNMSVNMRSNDAIWGMTNDVACFSLIHETIFTMVKSHIPDIEMGYYCHKVDSLHVYERHWDMLAQIVEDGSAGYKKIEIPRILNHEEILQLQRHLAYNGPITRSFEFTDWLLA